MKHLVVNKDIFITHLYYAFWLVFWALLFFFNVQFASFDLFFKSLLNIRNIFICICFIIATTKYMQFWHYFRLCVKKIKQTKLGSYIKIDSGAPGQGKTSCNVYELVLLGALSFDKLRLDYQIYKQKKERGKKWTIDDDMKLKQIEKSYKFYLSGIEQGYMPCLMSNQKIIVKWKGKKFISHPLTPEQAVGLANIPQYTIIFGDEIDKLYNSEMFKYDVTGRVKNIFKYVRQMGYQMLGNAQDHHTPFIELRRCVHTNEVHMLQRAVCKPALIKFLISILKAKRNMFDSINIKKPLDSMKTNQRMTTTLIAKLTKLYNSFGFRYCKSRYMNNTELVQNEIKRTINRYAMPANLNCIYDDCSCSDIMNQTQLEPEFVQWHNVNSLKLNEEENFNDKCIKLLKDETRQLAIERKKADMEELKMSQIQLASSDEALELELRRKAKIAKEVQKAKLEAKDEHKKAKQ